MAKTTHEFQAETKELLNLMIHSIYTYHEIFLRELISNASDAIDKLHFASLQNRDILEGNEDYEIFLVPDKDSHTLTISDNGLGMTKEEVIENLGTIAKSGTKAFLEQLQKAKEDNAEITDKELIGQFGVGFYSAFMVAEKVTVVTRKAGETAAVRWESTGDGSYTIEECEKEGRGTNITITLGKEFYGDEAEENFLDTWNLQNLVKKYSDYVRYTIKMNIEREEYTSLLYIPAKAPFNLYHADYEPGLQLYSRHVFIMDKCKDLLPNYLGFVKGLVDSPDLSLNISRELLQQSRELKTIGKNLEKTILKSLERMLKNDREKYEKFWAEYGKSLKIGIYNSMYTGCSVVDKLKELLLFASSKDGKQISLKEYVGRMAEGQKKIYYATGTDKNTIEKLPQMELLRDKGLEVLYLLDPVDEFAIETIRKYDDKEFQSISRGDLDLDDAESKEVKKEAEEIAKTNDQLVKDIKEALGDKVSEVKICSRLKTRAVC